mgnify:CR=1 FL=1
MKTAKGSILIRRGAVVSGGSVSRRDVLIQGEEIRALGDLAVAGRGHQAVVTGHAALGGDEQVEELPVGRRRHRALACTASRRASASAA